MALNVNNSLAHLDGASQAPYERQFLADHGDNNWRTNNSPLADYGENVSFADFPDQNIAGIILNRIGRDEKNCGMDLCGGAIGNALQDLLNSGVIGKALLTNMYDTRDPLTDVRDDLHHIEGDLLSQATWINIMGWQRREAPEGFSIILHRPKGALQQANPEFYRGSAHLLVDLLKPGGVLFTQVPRSLRWGRGRPDLQDICGELRSRDDVEHISTGTRICPKPADYELPHYGLVFKRSPDS